MKKLIIVGDCAFAEVAYEYFTYDSDYEVIAFAVEEAHIKKNSLFGLPVIKLEDIEKLYSPTEFHVFVALTYGKMNRNRTRLLDYVIGKGYEPASYISSKAFVWRNVKLGYNSFVFENNVVQPFVEIGNNTILWSGNHIGHHSKIGDNVFISSHVVISGYVTVGNNFFFGVNSTLANNLKIDNDVWIGPNSLVTKDVPEGALIKSNSDLPNNISTFKFFKVKF